MKNIHSFNNMVFMQHNSRTVSRNLNKFYFVFNFFLILWLITNMLYQQNEFLLVPYKIKVDSQFNNVKKKTIENNFVRLDQRNFILAWHSERECPFKCRNTKVYMNGKPFTFVWIWHFLTRPSSAACFFVDHIKENKKIYKNYFSMYI